MVFSDGDFLRVQYNAWRVADNVLVYTTDEKKAKEASIFEDHIIYGPQLIILGKGNVIDGLNRVLKEMAVKETKKVEFAPEEAFGERRADLVRVMHVADFRKKEIEPYPGLQLDLDGTIATVKSVNSGRVLVDANHPMAGEKIIYEITVVEKIEDASEKVKALAGQYHLVADKVALNKDTAEVEFGNKVEKNADYFVNKAGFVNAVFRYIPESKHVKVVEEFDRK